MGASDTDAVAVLKRGPDVLARRVLRGVMLSTPDAEEPVVVTSPGDAVWDLIQDPVEEADLVRAVATHFVGDPGEIERDVVALVDQLIELGAVVRGD